MKIDHNETLKFGKLYHVTLSSYTIANVANGTIMPTKTDLGYFYNKVNIDLTSLFKSLQEYTLPENTPQWKLDSLEKYKDSTPVFILEIDFVKIVGHQKPNLGHCEY